MVIQGTNKNDNLVGTSGDDTIQGLNGNDTLSGLGGNDRLEGGAGNDTLYGGTGNDVFNLAYSQNNDVVIDFVRGQDKVDVRSLNIGDWNTLKLLISNDGQDNALITTFFGGDLSQLKLNGINPSQLQATDFILNTVNQSQTIDGNTSYAYADQLFGGLGNDTLRGFRGNDVLFGEQGDDRLEGGADNDTLYGGTGNDTYSFLANTALGTDTVIETTTGGTDTINFSGTTVAVNLNLGTTTSQTINSNLKLILSANNVIENATGGTGNDSLTGNTLNNTLIGGAGNDTLSGGTGNDTYSFLANTALGTDTITETTTGSTDTINFSGTTVAVNVNLGLTTSQTINSNLKLILSANNVIENATGSTGNDSLTGNTLNNTLIGGDGNDQLQGLEGNDNLQGGNGNDTLTGGTGDDLLWGGLGNDILTGNAGKDKYQFQGSGVFSTSLGVDFITQFEVGQDQIVLSKTTFNAVTNNVGQALTDFAVVSEDQFVNASNAHIVFSRSTGSLFYNQDGNLLGAGKVFQFASLGNPNIALSSSDFSLIA
ncbi:calcium-binding protein [Dendronalium sp. ChiSLP03b]|uniref:calcium-binding protein n=1 Tax=Dendronalium sp. ChiSLP03b TaxID=3075381 RepID=UPI002AD54A4F|nr:M10 family metallopeptidase C-terminal domain-containing protein [Dendronalium sp. ChiSLP03b]MDZ8208507.1 M10 family metallopeptidase C-terminal domain-containing protein [Dendronalium sp. ChiSLP03b]